MTVWRKYWWYLLLQHVCNNRRGIITKCKKWILHFFKQSERDDLFKCFFNRKGQITNVYENIGDPNINIPWNFKHIVNIKIKFENISISNKFLKNITVLLVIDKFEGQSMFLVIYPMAVIGRTNPSWWGMDYSYRNGKTQQLEM